MTRLVLILFTILLLPLFVSGAHIITLVEPVNASPCVVAGNVDFEYHINEIADGDCQFWSNITGSWALQKYLDSASLGINTFSINFTNPNTILWGMNCADLAPPDLDWSFQNFTFTVTDAPYCAVLTQATCTKDPGKGSIAIVEAKLSNTNGINLESQDCAVTMLNSDGETIKNFKTMMIDSQTDLQIDENGNWINVGGKDVTLTDSGGNYLYEFEAGSNWGWVGDEYTVKLVCNGQESTCKFNLSSMEGLDTVNVVDTTKKLMGEILMIIILLALTLFTGSYIYNTYWRRS